MINLQNLYSNNNGENLKINVQRQDTFILTLGYVMYCSSKHQFRVWFYSLERVTECSDLLNCKNVYQTLATQRLIDIQNIL